MGIEGHRRPPVENANFDTVTEKVQNLYIGLAEKYLPEKDPLRAQIISFYSDSGRLQSELQNVFSGLTRREIDAQIESAVQKLEDRTFFIEHYQKIFERTNVRNGIQQRTQEDPIATEEEYELGIYKEGLEAQVREACFSLEKKGYKTFESGFREKDGDRDQYIGMYNKEIAIPDSVTAYFAEKGFTLSVIQQDDRTQINIHPERADAVTLAEWKQIWNELAEKLPNVTGEDFNTVKKYSLHTEFRERQDALKRVS